MTASRPDSALIPGIQALRALAVSLVVIYHLWPNRLTGGYVGVDVFFVISGYLITAHMIREINERGRLSVVRFYERRIRRLLPASLFVLVVTIVATVVLLPRLRWESIFGEIIAASLYVENWVLGAKAVDYLAGGDPSPVQHFWSLSVEEQFYIAVPAGISLTVILVSRSLRHRDAWTGDRRRALTRWSTATVYAVVASASLAWSIVASQDEGTGYFSTSTRAWEFAAGGLLATASLPVLTTIVRSVLSLAGVALIGVAAVVLDGNSEFPGYLAALPVVGTCLILVATYRAGSPPMAANAPFRAIVFVGGISYSLYLWHWPLIVFARPLLGRELQTIDKVVIASLAVSLAIVTLRYVENPVRFAARTGLSRRRLIIRMALASATVVALGTGGLVWTSVSTDQTASAIASLATTQPACLGAAAMRAWNRCERPFAVTETVDPAFARSDVGVGVAVGRCELGVGAKLQEPCVFGGRSDPTGTVALLGDSHAGQLIETIDVAFRDRGLRLVTYVKASCPGMLPLAGTANDDCFAWGEAAVNAIASSTEIETVLIANATAKYRGETEFQLSEDLILATVHRLSAAGKRVVLVRDPPASDRGASGTGGTDFPTCVSEANGSYDPCAIARSQVVTIDAMVRVATNAKLPLIDLSESFCGQSRCHAVIGGLLVYADGGHITASYARTLAPAFGAAFDAAVR